MDSEDETQPTQPDGVLVYRVDTPEGVQIKFENVGNIDPLVVPVLLELASKISKQQLGLS